MCVHMINIHKYDKTGIKPAKNPKLSQIIYVLTIEID